MILNTDDKNKTHLFWNTKKSNLEAAQDSDIKLLTGYKNSLDKLNELELENGESVDILNAKTDAFNKLHSEGSDILKESVKETQSYAENLNALQSSYEKAGQKASGFSGALGGVKNVAKSVGISIVNMAATMAISFAIQAAISGITYLIQKDGELRKAAYESSKSLEKENKSLEEYKTKITDLRQALSSSTLSESESYSIKKQLISVQDELTEKYGKQLGAIDLVNGSLKEQVGLIDEVINQNNRDWKIKNQEGINSSLDNVMKDLSGSNVLMPNGTYVGLKFSSATDEASRSLGGEIASFIRSQFGAEYEAGVERMKPNVIFNVKTKAQLKSQMDELYSFVEDYGEKHQIDVSKTLGSISKAHNYWFDENYEHAKETVDQWAEIEAQENERYSSFYASVTEARNRYEEAVRDGDQEAQKRAVQSMSSLSDELQKKEKDWLKTDASGKYINKESAAVTQYFQEIFDEWNDKTITLKFQIDFENDKNDIKRDLETAIKDWWGGDGKPTDIDLQSLYDKFENSNAFVTGASAEEEVYKNLKTAANQYNMEVKDLISVLAELGVVQSNVIERTPEDYGFTHLVNAESDSVKNLTDELNKIQSAYKSVKTVIQEYNKTGELSLASLESLISLGGEYIDNLFDENGNIKLNEEAYKALAQAKLNKLKIDVINNAIDNVKKLSDEAAATAYLKDRTDELAESEKDAAKATLANALASKFAQGGDTAKAAYRIQQETISIHTPRVGSDAL